MRHIRSNFLLLLAWTSIACQPMREHASEDLALALADENTTIVQQCELSDSSPVNDSQKITMEVTTRSQLFRIEQMRDGSKIHIVVTDTGITAFEFIGTGITGVNVPRAKAESLREIFGLAEKYKHINPEAGEVVTRNQIGPENSFLKLEGDPKINISLGFDIKDAKIDSSFFWQASTPSVLIQKAGRGIVPSPTSTILLKKPPYKLRFFSELEQGQEMQAEWYQKGFFPNRVEWQLNSDSESYRRELVCSPPESKTDRLIALNHSQIRSRVLKVLKKQSIVSDIKDISNDALTESTMDHYARLSGMNLVDSQEYDWEQKNFLPLKKQFIKGSLLGVCLRYQTIMEDQIADKICEDENVKNIFSRQSSKESFVNTLQNRMKYIVDSHSISEALVAVFQKNSKNISEDYDRFRDEICLKPLMKIFKKYNSSRCDSI